ncbi:MAG: pyruvate kinase [Flavobacteriales bacterium]|nr:pyruvate kinase [Flavobacteriales bacterium]HRE95947.1 pyruvate kinase [Flavobacteriales bacterium]HRJ36396.1 pyruvate kinase [Flavobacteriales bacterium]HRJ38180.1 pyruvate kinase [Flavobacteriales bacterium]
MKTLHPFILEKKTKIVATLGPASSSKEVLLEMMYNGANVFRINFSHGEYEKHEAVIATIRELMTETGIHVAILADLQGPKLRCGEMENNGVLLETGQDYILSTQKVVGNKERTYITYKEFPFDVKPGERVLMDDGKLVFEVTGTNGKDEVYTKVIQGGVLGSKKGLNLPNTKVSLPSLTEKDKADLEFALEKDVDWIGLSFVREARDIIELKHIIASKQKKAKVIAKIEKPEALEEIDDIIHESDGLMVARGDLGVEIPLQNVPLIQKMIIRKSLSQGKPVIVATQMMESMITAMTPSRAEVNDVANAVFDGADAVMLSGETSVGKHPAKVIETMSKIVMEAETFEGIYHKESIPNDPTNERFITDSICFNATRLGQRVGASAIITMTHSGYTAFKISSQRPKAKIVVFTGNRKMLETLSLVWGVTGIYYDKMVSTDHTIADAKYMLKKLKLVNEGELVINIASMPIEDNGKSNMLKLSRVE